MKVSIASFAILALSFSLASALESNAKPPTCSKVLNGKGYITPGYFCCNDPFGIERCVDRNVLADTIYLNPPLTGTSLDNWKRAFYRRDSIRVADSIKSDAEDVAYQIKKDSADRVDSLIAQAEKKKYRASKKWPKRVWTAIDKGSVFIGMTSAQAEESWGKPDDVNRTTSRSGVSEQWVYESGSYLYFQDGILTTIQN